MLRVHSPLTVEEETIVRKSVDVGYTVHRELGPGFKERIYEKRFASS